MALDKERVSQDVYGNPFYYDIAFGFRDIVKEVNFFEECIKRFSKVKVSGSRHRMRFKPLHAGAC